MATAYTNLLGLALPVTGELNGTWGDVVNNSITELVEDAIAGSATASVTSADWTLTTTGSGAANQARSAILIPTGTPGVSRNIIAPSSSKAYIVDNQSNAAVVIKGAATSGVSVAAGTAALVAWDGADFVLVAQDLANVTGVLAVAKGGTGATTLTANNVILGNGTSAVQVVAPGTTGNVLTSNGTTWASTAPAPGGIDYVYKTANYTVSNNEGVLADTSGGAFTVTLPATPAAGDQCVVADAGAAFGTNNLIVARNGSTIGGVADNLVLDITGVSVQFVYDGTTWEVYAQIGGNGGTAVTLDGVQTLTNKTISGSSNTLTNISLATAVTGTLPAANGGTGLTSPGTSGNVLTSNGTAWTSAAPAPSAGTLQAIATGSLSDGSTVIINADGTVSAVSGSNTTAFDSNQVLVTSAAYDASNNRVVITYADNGNSNYGTAIVGTVSGGTITFGAAVVFESVTIASSTTATVFDSSNNKIVICYRGTSNYGRAIVGTVSGTSISFGTAVNFEVATTVDISAIYDSTNNRVVIAYRDSGNSNYGTAIVGTVSGTSISFGTAVVFASVFVTQTSTTYDSTNNRVVIAYRDGANSNYGTAIVGTVSGTSISFGTAVVFESADIGNISTTYDSTNNRVVIAYRDAGNSDYGTAIVGTVSGTSISFGTAVVFESGTINTTQSTSISFDSSAGKILIAYYDGFNSAYGTAVVGTVSGTSISFGTPYVISTAGTSYFASTYDSTNQRVVVVYANSTTSGDAVPLESSATQLTNLTSENYIGISNAAYTNGQTATIQVVGSVDDAQAGLTAGQAYYVQLNGSLSQTPATPSVFAGTAVSATKLIVKG